MTSSIQLAGLNGQLKHVFVGVTFFLLIAEPHQKR